MKEDKQQKKRLVEETTAKLRDLILDNEPETQIGSLNEVAEQLGVGIVTVQQSARILEHEGLLAVRRGPGGGYYGTRPDNSALERAFATYMRVHDFNYREAFEMMILLDCDIIPAAAASADENLQGVIAELINRIPHCNQPESRIQFETDLRDVLFKAVQKPFLELLARVTMQLYQLQSPTLLFSDEDMIADWKTGRERILKAIQQQDAELARFEAERYRTVVLSRLRPT